MKTTFNTQVAAVAQSAPAAGVMSQAAQGIGEAPSKLSSQKKEEESIFTRIWKFFADLFTSICNCFKSEKAQPKLSPLEILTKEGTAIINQHTDESHLFAPSCRIAMLIKAGHSLKNETTSAIVDAETLVKFRTHMGGPRLKEILSAQRLTEDSELSICTLFVKVNDDKTVSIRCYESKRTARGAEAPQGAQSGDMEATGIAPKEAIRILNEKCDNDKDLLKFLLEELGKKPTTA